MGEDRDFPRAGGPPGDGLRLGSFRVAMEARENRGLPTEGWMGTRVVSNQDWQFCLMPRRCQCSGVSKGKGRGMARVPEGQGFLQAQLEAGDPSWWRW